MSEDNEDFLAGRPLAARKVRQFEEKAKGKRIPSPSRPAQEGKAPERREGDRPGIRMVEVGDKPVVHREAEAEGFLRLEAATVRAVREGGVEKGDPLPVARVAAIQAVKRTPEWIPLCHPLPVTGVDVKLDVEPRGVHAKVRVRADGKTGVEMEALTAVTAALLTVWDMVKSLEKDADGQYPTTRIEDVRIVHKVKGES